MAKSTMTYMEAKEQFPILTQNRYDALEDAAEFPALPDSFAGVTAGKYRTRNERQYKPQKQKRLLQDVNIADQVQIMTDKKQKTGEPENTGVALFNKFKVSEFEQWAQRFEEQRRKSINEQLSRVDQNGDGAAALGAAGSQKTATVPNSTSNRLPRGSTVDWSQAANNEDMEA